MTGAVAQFRPQNRRAKSRWLLIVAAGDQSLHPQWDHPDRTFDLCVNYYGNNSDIATTYKAQADYFCRYTGGPWGNFRKLLEAETFWREYDWVWRIDDDIAISTENVMKAFEICDRFQFSIAQPSLEKDNIAYTHLTHQPGNIFRFVEFVEIQTPIFRKDVLGDLVFPLLTANSDCCDSGWGFDVTWSKLLQYRNLAVIDAVTGQHTKKFGSGALYAAGKPTPDTDLETMLQRYGLNRNFRQSTLLRVKTSGYHHPVWLRTSLELMLFFRSSYRAFKSIFLG